MGERERSSHTGAGRATLTRRRKTVAAFIDYMTLFSGGYQAQVRAALDEQCKLHDVNLWLVVGQNVDEDDAQRRAYNSIYGHVGPTCVDGLIVLSTCLGTQCGVAGMERFLQRYYPLPCCSLGMSVPRVPSVVVDNRRSMDLVLEHLIVDHGYRRIAFIAGTASHPEAEARLQAYRDALARHEIDVDPALLAHGNFVTDLGSQAMNEILDRESKIDAVVAANDLMAVGAIQALRKRGFRVPEDVAVTGFDDLAVSRLEDPPLTTVAQPYSAMAQASLASVLNQIDGRAVPSLTELPARLVVRRSCGCQRVKWLGEESGVQDLVSGHERCREVDQLGASIPTEASDATGNLLDQTVLARERQQVRQRNHIDETLRRIISVGERISVALDLTSLANAMAESLPWAGYRSAILSRYVGERYHDLQVLFCSYEGERVSVTGTPYPADMLLAPDVFPSGLRHTLLVFPLVFDLERLGVVVFAHSRETHGYQMIRDQIAAQMYSVALHQQVVEKTALHERSVQERAASHQRMESLAVLAGGVAHDLNNVLGPLVALPDILLSELGSLTGTQETLSAMRADLESIRSAALRASHTIKDLLTASRQGMTRKKHVDLNRVVFSYRNREPARFESAHASVAFAIETEAEPLVVWGDEGQLARAIDNLVRNAIEAIDDAGTVRISAAWIRLDAPLAGYETVPIGDYATVTVADDGVGIDAVDRSRVFEPFFTRKRGDDAGKSGLGLAVVHGVVKDHEGFIDLQSRRGGGTQVTLYFPRARVTVGQRSIPPEAASASARILLVDDEPVQLRTGRRVLTHLGFQVETVNSGRKACQLFAAAANRGERPYDLVIMDVILNEERDGLDTLEEIHQLFPDQRAILASGHAPDERVELAVARGVKWLTKPYTKETLERAVQAMLSKRDTKRPKDD